jgi:hypothetical protein
MSELMIIIWVNYSDLTVTSLESCLGFGELSKFDLVLFLVVEI